MAGWLALHAGISVLMTWAALAYARRRNLVDLPGERRSHAVPTPRGGGIGIACALLAGCVVALIAGTARPAAVLGFAGGLMLVAGIGWVDDHRPLSPWLRLAVQCLAGALLAWGLHGAEGQWGWAILTLALVPGLVNVWNFMDGINGLATSQAMLCAVAFAWLAPGTAYAALAFGVAAAVFLPFNFPRARIFLGDVGSGTLGYALAALASVAAVERGPDGAILVLLPLSAFLVDASLTLGARMRGGERWWQPHTSHLYQRWVKTAQSHTFVTCIYATFSLAASILALSVNKIGPWQAAAVTVLWFACASLGWFFQRRRLVSRKSGFN
ncbi:MraY family glycosyltransferase [Pseudoxanthomonas daejeonensis]|nr:glycosyltransferase family 4 protein [Pseudoxanthomonas daejeonensis]